MDRNFPLNTSTIPRASASPGELFGADEPLFPIDREPQFGIESEPQFTMAGWRRWAALSFASAPAVVFLALVLLHVLTHA